MNTITKNNRRRPRRFLVTRLNNMRHRNDKWYPNRRKDIQ